MDGIKQEYCSARGPGGSDCRNTVFIRLMHDRHNSPAITGYYSAKGGMIAFQVIQA